MPHELLKDGIPWVVMTRDPGVYVVGLLDTDLVEVIEVDATKLRVKLPVREIARLGNTLPLYKAALMRRKGAQVEFEKIDVVAACAFMNVEGQMVHGPLDQPYLKHYRDYISALEASIPQPLTNGKSKSLKKRKKAV